MENFETTLLIAPDITKNTLNQIENKFENLIQEKKGSIIGKEDWGLRDLSYQIKGSKKAFYSFFQINIEGKKIQELKKNLSQNEKILRYLFIKVSEQQDLPTKLVKSSE